MASQNNFVGYHTNLPPPVISNLNPLAREWHPITDRASQDRRSVFLTFSMGFPVSPQQVYAYFARKFGGASIEKVVVNRPWNPRDQPKCGKVVFYASYIPMIVLSENGGNGERSRHYILGRPVLCKKYCRRYFFP